jgi:hypothetical protein
MDRKLYAGYKWTSGSWGSPSDGRGEDLTHEACRS